MSMKVSLELSLNFDSALCCGRYSWDEQYLTKGNSQCVIIFCASGEQQVAKFAKDGVVNERKSRTTIVV